jgi:hypothetical protein
MLKDSCPRDAPWTKHHHSTSLVHHLRACQDCLSSRHLHSNRSWCLHYQLGSVAASPRSRHLVLYTETNPLGLLREFKRRGLRRRSGLGLTASPYGGPLGDDGGAADQALAGRVPQPRAGDSRRALPALQLAGAEGCGSHDGARDARDKGYDAGERAACRE